MSEQRGHARFKTTEFMQPTMRITRSGKGSSVIKSATELGAELEDKARARRKAEADARAEAKARRDG